VARAEVAGKLIEQWLTTKGKYFAALALLVVFLFPIVTLAALSDSLTTIVSQFGYVPTDQAFCAEQNGNSVVSYRSDAQMVPASVSKLYVSDWALSVRDPSYRYQTKFYFSGGVLTIVGSLDPQFVEDDLKRIFAALTKTERARLSKIVFDRNIVFNWQTNPMGIGSEVARVAKRYFGRTIQVRYAPVALPTTRVRLTLSSPPLVRVLKEMNTYSNNVTADAIFTDLGGPLAFKYYMEKTYGSVASDITFGTGSGINDNLTTCRLTLVVLKHLYTRLLSLGLLPSDVLVIPTVDPGSTQRRFTAYGPSLAIKTGYVWHTQTVAGILSTDTTPVYFAVFTNDVIHPQVPRGAALVDALVAEIAKGYRTTFQVYPRKDHNTLDERIVK
jgi:D-alanyl-D-alanine carboxypeptidase/D-alanyl-D-alanine-endopeptidase (penicillin-binding protein 4)